MITRIEICHAGAHETVSSWPMASGKGKLEHSHVGNCIIPGLARSFANPPMFRQARRYVSDVISLRYTTTSCGLTEDIGEG